MPTYEYECEKCHKTFEVEQRISDSKLTTQPVSPTSPQATECGGSVKRLISGSSFFMKGGGKEDDTRILH